MCNAQNIHKKRFYSKLKTTKKISSPLKNREDLELEGSYWICEKENIKVSKSFKNRIQINNFKIVNMGADANIVCTLVASPSVTGEKNSSRQANVS